MQDYTDAQTVNLQGMDQGNFMSIVLTGASGNCVLEFKNGGSDDWSIDPTFTGTVAGGILVERVKCLSASTRLRFLAAPGAAYWLSVVWDITPSA